jgi:hypothetical protein
MRPPHVLVSLATSRHTLRALCPHVIEPSIEHVIPQLHLRGSNATRDAHNLMIIPKRLNSHRQAYRFCATPMPDTDWENLDSLGFSSTCQPLAHKNTRRGLFVPPEAWRGLIARKACYMVAVYPVLMSLVFTRVLCPRLIREWNERYPVADHERATEQAVARIQLNRNPFVLHPERVNRTIGRSDCWSSHCVCHFSPTDSLADGKLGTDAAD